MSINESNYNTTNEQNNSIDNNDDNSFITPRIHPRYINITEDITTALSHFALQVYTVLRFEADYKNECSTVKKNIQFIVNRVSFSRRKVFDCLNELESYGLLKREKQTGAQNIFWVSHNMHYFKKIDNNKNKEPDKKPEKPKKEQKTSARGVVHGGNGVVHEGNGVVHGGNDIYTNSFHYFFQIYKKSGNDVFLNNDKICIETEHHNTENKLIEKDIETSEEYIKENDIHIKENDISYSDNKKVDEKEMINTDYEYPDTLYMQQQKADKNQMLKSTYKLTDDDIKSFEIFWNLYPVKKNKIRAQNAWFCQGCHKIAVNIMIKLSEQLKQDTQYLEGYAPNPANYIFQERWTDEIHTRKRKKTKSAKTENKSNLDNNSTDWASSLMSDLAYE